MFKRVRFDTEDLLQEEERLLPQALETQRETEVNLSSSHDDCVRIRGNLCEIFTVPVLQQNFFVIMILLTCTSFCYYLISF